MNTTRNPSEFLLAEYTELRGEILKRTEIQHQLISIALVAFATLASVGLKGSATALLVYPMLAMFLSAVWSYNDIRIMQLGIYIRDRIEYELLGVNLGWEHALASDNVSALINSLTLLATRGILWGTEVVAVGLFILNKLSAGGFKIGLLDGDMVFLILDIVAILFTIIILRRHNVLSEEIAESIRKTEN